MTRRNHKLQAAIEALETRRLMSNIVWANEGADNFGVYGGNANVARAIVNKAIIDWERVILNFNYDDTGPNLSNTFNLTLSAAALAGGDRGTTTITGRDDATDKKPTSATITMDDDGALAGWYFDPVVDDDGEYTQPLNLFAANIIAGGPGGNDFYRTVLHEIGHAMGIARSTVHLLKIADFMVDSGINDPLDSGADLMTLNTFGGSDPEYVVTTNGGVHLWEGDGPGGINLREHPNELLNPGRTVPNGTNRRQLISDTDALLLLDVYNYQVVMPSQQNTFLANVNSTTGVLTLNGDLAYSTLAIPTPIPNDIMDMEYSGGITMTIELANGSLVREQVFEFEFSSIVVNAGNGNDTIEINGVAPSTPATVNLGIGDDTVIFGGEAGSMTSIASNVTVNGEAGTNNAIFSDGLAPAGSFWTVESGSTRRGSSRTFFLNDMQSQLIQCSNFHDGFAINGTAMGTTLTIDGNAGNEVMDIGAGNLATRLGGPIIIDGDVGTDHINLQDYADTPGNDLWTFNAGSVQKAGAPLISYSALEIITAVGGVQNDVFNANAGTPTLYLEGGFGNDTFNIGTGDLNALTRVGVTGGVGDDLLIVNDFADSGADTYQLAASTQIPVDMLTKPGAPGAFQLMEINTQGSLEIERTILRANVSDNLIYVSSGRGLELQGGGGHDIFQVVNHVPGLPVVIEGGAGLDRVLLNDDNVGTVSAVFNGTQDLAELDLFGGSSLSIAAGSNSIIDVSSFMLLASNSLLDINDNTMIFRAAASAGNISYFRSRLASAFNGNTWNGTNGITSTTARNSSAADGIGYGTATQLGRSSINSIPISGNDIVLDHTLYGDADLNHNVNLVDYNRVSANFSGSNRSWAQGDFNYDGTPNLSDYNLLTANFGQVLSVAGTGSSFSPMSATDRLRWEVEILA